MPYYAQLTDGVVTAVTETHSPIDAPNMVQIESLDVSIMGDAYVNGAFVQVNKPSPQPTELSELQFRGLFTQAEKRAIYAAAAVEIDVQIWLDDLRALSGKPVLLSDPRTVDGVQALEAAGIIGPGRAAQILAAQPHGEV